MIEKYQKKKQDLHMVFINLEKTYNGTLEGNHVWGCNNKSENSMQINQNFSYKDRATSKINFKSISFYTRQEWIHWHIQNTLSWYMLFADDIDSVDETCEDKG